MSSVDPSYRSSAIELGADTLEVPLVALACGLLGFVPEAVHGRVGSAGTLGLLMIAFALVGLVSRFRTRTS